MKYPVKYKFFKKDIFDKENFKITPIRYEDRYDIMRWRNEQMYHLRQENYLTKDVQDKYFNEVVIKIFNEEKPKQILFSFLEGNICIGYGGLVHINWINRNAEISFIMNTELEKINFEKYWNAYLYLIECFAFKELKLHKIHTFAFDLRPNLYEILELNNFKKEAILKEHHSFDKGFIDVIIHAKINKYENL